MTTVPFEQVVTRHGATVLRVCTALLGPDHAQDAWSETFLAALGAYPDLDEGANLEAWLVTIARRKAIDHIRRTSRQARPTAVIPERPGAHYRPGGWERDLWEALGDLPDKQRHAVVYHHIAGLPHAEVAAILGGSPAAARRACADGVAALRRHYLEEAQ
ncbi:RNA polymerase sigma factor [Pseudactinotalea sp. Z1748]|uniref:RNA polymerase sigma factor n=1 Tax=Pseudactinotalea sp. Z1748 TaxID=3413027 RepID=UPI003C7E606C